MSQSTQAGRSTKTLAQRSPQPRATGRLGLVLCALAINTFMSMLDQSIVATAGPTVVGELGGLDRYAWIFTAYMLAFSVSMPIYGKLGDLFGRRPAHLSAIAIFLAGSMACGMAQTMGELIAFRVLQGIGGGGLVVLGMATLGDVLEPRQRARYQGYFALVFALANLSGPILGGLVTDQLGWRWVFFINLPLGLVALVLLATFLRTIRGRERPRIDYAGAATLSAAVIAVLLALTLGGDRYPWSSGPIVGLTVAGIMFFAAWVLIERVASEPLLPLNLFQNRTFSISGALAFITSLAFFGCVIFVPLSLQFVSGVSPTRTGLLFLPAMVSVAVASLLAGWIIGRTGRYKWLFVSSMAIATFGTVLMATMDVSTGATRLAVYLAVVGFGVGLSQQVTTLVAQQAAPAKDLGVATSSVGFLRNIGVPVGAALYGAILNAALAAELPRRLPAGIEIDAGGLTPQGAAALPDHLRAGVAEAYGYALAEAFRWIVPVLLAGLVLSLWLQDIRLPRRSHGAAPATSALADR